VRGEVALSFRRADTLFLLPRPAARAVVLGESSMRAAFEAAGIETADGGSPGRDVELVVTIVDHLADALRLRPEAVIVEGRGGRRSLTEHGYSASEFLPLPAVEDPAVVLPLNNRLASAYAVNHFTDRASGLRAVRNHLARVLLKNGVLPPVRETISLGLRQPAPPFLVGRAIELLGLPQDVEWHVVNGEGRSFRRGAFLLFPVGSPAPRWVLKFSRVIGDSEPFLRDRRGLEVAASGGVLVTSHAPSFLGAFDVDGYHASVETAAVGDRLDRILNATSVSEASKLRLLEQLAQWTVDVMVETSVVPGRSDPERERALADAVERGLPPNLAAIVRSVPAVLQHNDLWTWHVVVTDDAFTVIDWEFAARRSLPLWDLWYLLFDAATQLERVAADDRERYFVRLFRGEERMSKLVLGWTRRAVEVLGLAPESVGPLATAVWAQYGLFYERRLGPVHLVDPDTPPRGRRLPVAWLEADGLGYSWDAWRRS
jgi:hypothetical protein